MIYNKVIIIGRLAARPELVTMSNEKSVTRVALAVNRRLKLQNGKCETDFTPVMIWGRLAGTLVSYAGEGSLPSVDGELRTRKYEKDGHANYVAEVLCHSFRLLESRAQRAIRENNMANDLADLVLEEEELLF